MKTYTTEDKRRIKVAIKMIKTWKKNIRFIKHKLKTQDLNDYKTRYGGRIYHPYEVLQFEEKINKAKQVLKGI